MKRFSFFVACVSAIALTTTSSMAAEGEGKWADLSTAVGLQMWQPIYVATTSDGTAPDPAIKPTVGGVLKLNYIFGENMGLHFRGTYGVHSATVPNRDAEGQAWAVGLGMPRGPWR